LFIKIDEVTIFIQLEQWFPTGDEFLPREKFPLYGKVTYSI